MSSVIYFKINDNSYISSDTQGTTDTGEKIVIEKFKKIRNGFFIAFTGDVFNYQYIMSNNKIYNKIKNAHLHKYKNTSYLVKLFLIIRNEMHKDKILKADSQDIGVDLLFAFKDLCMEMTSSGYIKVHNDFAISGSGSHYIIGAINSMNGIKKIVDLKKIYRIANKYDAYTSNEYLFEKI